MDEENNLKKLYGKKSYKYLVLLFLVIICIVLFIISIYYGGNAESVSVGDITQAIIHQTTGEVYKDVIVKEIRFPKVFGAILVGMALAGSGLMLQVLFRNLLASPYTTGISSGVLLMVSLVLFVNSFSEFFKAFVGYETLIAGWIGGLLSTLILIAIAHKSSESNSIIVISLLASYMFSGLTSYLISNAPVDSVKQYYGFSMGEVSKLTLDSLYPMTFAIIVFIILAIYLVKPLNALLFGENYAKSFGANIKQIRVKILLTTSFVVGLIIPLVGLMAFVGISGPYLARPIIKTSDNRYLLPASMLVGAILMLVCYLISLKYYVPIAMLTNTNSLTILPIGAVLDIIGGIVVLYLIIKGEKKIIIQ
ncbi:FecCD family ABC transporter permease [Methanococcus voltae]|uniref:Iron complex transport system permease protein n=2 Tax=Methanococcus voltae TaxID=2188 RepID=A0A8J7UR15_METVO|nr:iron ABC transporter permease [Methanococcus voltae]MBP2171749.1 iron complex transport system permease protein [Methanococcus voltae]MBP2201313.1 iron complex transport system permease protein [Methanococcus voltae]MCS3922745.1 iron complex transport system permease protein [Methanococcus voltae PS]